MTSTTENIRTLPALRDEALRLLLDYRRASRDARTPIVRLIALAMVEAREHFLNAEGEPDWRGVTYQYRQWVSEVYSAANFDPKTRASVQSAVRYHLGSVLRERLDEDTLRDLGFQQESPKERSQERRLSRNATLNALNHGTLDKGDVLAVTVAYNMLNTVDGNALADLPSSQLEVLREALKDIEARAQLVVRSIDHAKDDAEK